MSLLNRIHLKASSILSVPLNTYDSDFTFIVNGEEFKTSRIISDILSPAISRLHSTDPTADKFTINTVERGDFRYILNLATFNDINLPESEVPFISEVTEILNNDSIEYLDKNEEISIKNVIKYVKIHEKFPVFYSNRLSTEIEFISSHFHELCEENVDEFISLSFDTIFEIVNHKKLKLKNEDQLLKFINVLYSENSEYSVLYENVLFDNVTSESIQEFISIYDINDISKTIWNSLSKRLEKEIKNKRTDRIRIQKKSKQSKRYVNEDSELFEYSQGNEFNGILAFLRKKSDDKIKSEIEFTSSSVISSDVNRGPHVVSIFDNQLKYFHSKNEENSWFCLDFKNKKVVLTNYSLRSFPYVPNCFHPRSWVIEGSNDNLSWNVVDERIDCPYLNGKNLVFTFNVNRKNSKAFRFIRMRLTGPNWDGSNYFGLDSFEIFGLLEKK